VNRSWCAFWLLVWLTQTPALGQSGANLVSAQSVSTVQRLTEPIPVALLLANPAGGLQSPLRTLLSACEYLLYLIVLLLASYMLRHYVFTLNRLFARQRHPYVDVDTATWPRITVFIAAHNEESVIEDSIAALLEVD
jgi:hypothetical protein